MYDVSKLEQALVGGFFFLSSPSLLLLITWRTVKKNKAHGGICLCDHFHYLSFFLNTVEPWYLELGYICHSNSLLAWTKSMISPGFQFTPLFSQIYSGNLNSDNSTSSLTQTTEISFPLIKISLTLFYPNNSNSGSCNSTQMPFR